MNTATCQEFAKANQLEAAKRPKVMTRDTIS